MNKFYSVLLIALCLFGAFVPAVRSDDGSDWSDENDREVNYDASGSSVEFESQDNTLGNEIKFHAEVSGEGLYVQVEYKTSNDSTESEVSFQTVISFVYEYQETNNVDGYQAGADTLVQSWKLGDQTWTDFSCTTSGTPTVYSCDISTGIIGATIHITDGVTDVSGVPMKPSGAKIDVFLTKASANPIAVAFGFKSDTDNEYQVENESDEEASGFTTESEKQLSIGTDSFFSWIETATINSVTVNVINSDLIAGSDIQDASGDYNYIIFSFNTTEIGTITWDPKASVGSSVGSGASSLVPSVLVLLFALFALMY